MSYTVQDYISDLAALNEVIDSPEFDLPESEWPRLRLQDGESIQDIYFPQNNPLARRHQHFIIRYGEPRGYDYAHRFYLVDRFISDHHRQLIKDDIIHPGDTPAQESINAAFLEFLFAQFREPTAGKVFPSHRLLDHPKATSYRRVLREFEKWLGTSDSE